LITLDISSSGIRVMETSDNKIVSWASHSMEPGIFEDGVIVNSEALGIIIKELLNSSGIKGNRITASVSGLYSLTRIIIVPTPLEVSVAEEAVVEAVENLLPVTHEETYLSWESIGLSEGGHQVITHTVPKETIDEQIKAIKTAGMSIRVLDLKPMALARTVNQKDALVLNIEPDSFDIVMIIEGLAEVVRTAAWQQEDMSLEEKAEYLITALDTTVGFYDTSRPNFPFGKSNPLFITGQLSEDIELVNRIQAGLRYTEGKFEIPFEYPEHFPISQYATNIGLSMKGTGTRDNEPGGYITPDINLLPKNYKPWKPSRKQIYFSVAFIIVLAILFPMYTVTSNAMAETSELQKQQNSLNELLDLRKAEIAKRDPLKQAVEEYNTIINLGGGFREDYETITGIAKELKVNIPSINHLGSIIKFSCLTDNYQVFRQFITALEASGRFLSPIIPPEGYPYIKSGEITLEVNPDR
jgi:type IV pilus assembly protein PilM